MYTVEFQISVCCVWVVFVDRKLKVFTSAFPQYFWVIGAASRPHCSQCFHLHTAAGGQLHAEGLWAGRVWQGPSPQVRAAPAPGSCHLPATGTSACRAGSGASLAQGTSGGQSPGMAGQGHGGGLGRGRHGSEEDEGRCSPSMAEGPACLSSQGPDKSRWQITSARQCGATASFGTVSASFGTVSFLFPL